MNYIGLDTETCNSFSVGDKVDLTQSLVYDAGWMVINDKGRCLRKRSFLVKEIFCDDELMHSAYFADKIPMYLADLAKGKRQLASFMEIFWTFQNDKKKYHVVACFAHNAGFDKRALNNTLRYLTGSNKRWFYPYGLELWDTLKLARNTINRTEEYTNYCIENGYQTKHKKPQNRLTAEILWRYISGNNDFNESHTGLEDVRIEKEILMYCLNLNPEAERIL